MPSAVMMQILPKWKVTIIGDHHTAISPVMWVHAFTANDVMRQIANIQFTESGSEQPASVHIQRVREASTV